MWLKEAEPEPSPSPVVVEEPPTPSPSPSPPPPEIKEDPYERRLRKAKGLFSSLSHNELCYKLIGSYMYTIHHRNVM